MRGTCLTNLLCVSLSSWKVRHALTTCTNYAVTVKSKCASYCTLESYKYKSVDHHCSCAVSCLSLAVVNTKMKVLAGVLGYNN